MASAGKVIGISALVAGGIWAISKLVGTGIDAMAMLDTFDYDLNIKKWDWGYPTIKIELEVDVKNPSKFTVEFEKPYLDIYFAAPGTPPEKATKIASSLPTEEIVEIGKVGHSKFNITLELDALSLLEPIKDIINILVSGINWRASSFPEWVHNIALIKNNVDNIYPCVSINVLTNITKVNGVSVSMPLNKRFTLE